MNRIARIVASMSAVALAGYALWVLLLGPSSREVEQMADDVLRGVDGELVDAREDAQRSRARLREYAQAVSDAPASGLPGDDLVEDDPPPAGLVPGEVDRTEARRGFERIMKRVEVLGKRRRRLTQEEWRDTYRAANDAFSALSAHLDARDTDQLAELEEAHVRLTEGLRRVRVRGKKFREP